MSSPTLALQKLRCSERIPSTGLHSFICIQPKLCSIYLLGHVRPVVPVPITMVPLWCSCFMQSHRRSHLRICGAKNAWRHYYKIHWINDCVPAVLVRSIYLKEATSYYMSHPLALDRPTTYRQLGCRSIAVDKAGMDSDRDVAACGGKWK